MRCSGCSKRNKVSPWTDKERNITQPSRDFWRTRRVFLTGHTGFKGAWMNLWLKQMGAEVIGYALAPHTQPSLHELCNAKGGSNIGDIRDAAKVQEALRAADPDVVIHMAAQALVRESYRDPITTFATNVLGTGILLQACRDLNDCNACSS